MNSKLQENAFAVSVANRCLKVLLMALFLVFFFIDTWVASSAQTQTLAPIVIKAAEEKSLTMPARHEAKEIIERIAGGVALVPDDAWRDTQAATVKDMLDYTPGVFAQPKWGEDTRLSIRGSGLSRYYHMRGIGLYQDGIPLNNADGSTDF